MILRVVVERTGVPDELDHMAIGRNVLASQPFVTRGFGVGAESWWVELDDDGLKKLAAERVAAGDWLPLTLGMKPLELAYLYLRDETQKRYCRILTLDETTNQPLQAREDARQLALEPLNNPD